MATMKAAQWDPAQKEVVVNIIPIPEPGPGQFLVKVKSASLCHSDMMAIETPDRKIPVTLGHEGVGYIEKIHPSAEGKGFKIGDGIGSLYFNGCCFECSGCLIHNMYCETGKQLLQGFTTDGYFAEYVVVDWQNAIILPSSLNIEKSAPLFCAGITAFHAVDSCELKSGEWVGVIGCGGLGQLGTQYAKAMGFNVIAIDISEPNLEITKSQGADYAFNSMTDASYVTKIKELTEGGVHAAIIFSNADAAYAGAPKIIRLGGTMMVIGIAKNDFKVSTMDLCTGKYKIKAESTSIPQRMKKAIDFTAKHGIEPKMEVRKLEDVNNMVNEMLAGKAKTRMGVVF